MAHEQEPNKKPQYPLNSNSYKILQEIGVGVSAIVYKAICESINSTIVAIKSIDLDQSCTKFDNIRRETKAMCLLSHPNILNAHCSFIVDRHLWVVMPFMSAGSVQSIITSCFPDGLSEPCIAMILKETLKALSYLHNQGHLHRDVKAGNILIDSNGAIKLADFGVSASLYESVQSGSSSSSSSSSQLVLNELAGTPYWMAPEVIHSHTGYSVKADIWSFGITALELAYGRPPLSDLPPSKSLLMKITKRFRFSDYDQKSKNDERKKFSKAFKDMVASCLDQDPSRRPSAEKLLKHSFFKNCKGADFLVKNVLQGLPSVEDRFKEYKIINKSGGDNNDEDDDFEGDSIVKHRRISGWNFNEDGFELDPVFPSESKDDSIVKQVRFGGETIIQDKETESSGLGESNLSSPAQVVEEGQGVAHSEYVSGDSGISNIEGVIGGGGVDRNIMLESLVFLRRSLDEERQQVTNLIGMLGVEGSGEVTREEQMVQGIERLRMELENERKKNFELEMELEFLKIQISGAYNSGGTESTD